MPSSPEYDAKGRLPLELRDGFQFLRKSEIALMLAYRNCFFRISSVHSLRKNADEKHGKWNEKTVNVLTELGLLRKFTHNSAEWFTTYEPIKVRMEYLLFLLAQIKYYGISGNGIAERNVICFLNVLCGFVKPFTTHDLVNKHGAPIVVPFSKYLPKLKKLGFISVVGTEEQTKYNITIAGRNVTACWREVTKALTTYRNSK